MGPLRSAPLPAGRPQPPRRHRAPARRLALSRPRASAPGWRLTHGAGSALQALGCGSLPSLRRGGADRAAPSFSSASRAPLPPPRRASAPPTLQRPLRRFRRGAAALPHGAYARWRPDALNGSARRGSALPAPPPSPPSLAAASHARSHGPCPPLPTRSAGGFRLGPSAQRGALQGARRRSPRLFPCPRLSRREARLLFPPRPPPLRRVLCQRKRVRSAAILEPGTRRNAKAASASRGVCPQQRWVAALTGRARRLRFPSFFWDYSLNAVTPSADCEAHWALRCLRSLRSPVHAGGAGEAGGRAVPGAAPWAHLSISPPHPRSESCLAPAEERAGCGLSTPQIRPPRNKARSPVHRFQLTHGAAASLLSHGRAQPLPAAGRRAGGFWPGGSHAALWTGDSQSAQRVPPTQCKGGFL